MGRIEANPSVVDRLDEETGSWISTCRMASTAT
jgi:hypothetical protein